LCPFLTISVGKHIRLSCPWKTKSRRDTESLEEEYLTNTDGRSTERGKLTPPSSLNFRGSLALLDYAANQQFATFKCKKHEPKKLTGAQEANLANIMTKLAEQKTSSYRRSVIVPTPESVKGFSPFCTPTVSIGQIFLFK
jgi:hypothetical protein